MSNIRRILRKMGYSSDSQGIIERYINTNGAWDSHLKHSRAFILELIKNRNIENLAVYGSGWLLDFPLEEIAVLTGKITLFDVIHPPQIIQKVKRFKNITIETVDITGGAMEEAFESVSIYRKAGIIPDFQSWSRFQFQYQDASDYSISLNLLSQIGELITNYLTQFISLSEQEIETITGILQKSHLDILPPGKSCIITDTLEKMIGPNERIEKTHQLIHCPFLIPAVHKKWEWNFDPLREYHPGYQTVSEVVAFEL